MERACRERDASYDGIFFLAVRTTGVFCRPSCPARRPLPRNVEYFPSAREALKAGYRACMRCRPADADVRPEWVRALLEEIDRAPSGRITEEDLHERGIDPSTARRYFMKHYGMTFQAFARSRRMGEAQRVLRGGGALDDAVFECGYESHSGFRDAFARVFGKPPGRSRASECVSLGWFPSPLGPLVAGSIPSGICLLEFADRFLAEPRLASARRAFHIPLVPRSTDLLKRLSEEVSGYFAREVRRFTVPLVCSGTPFQRRVWDELLKIPYGETRSYDDLARAIGSPAGRRAVGSANGRNPIAIVIPCHRVVNKDGRLGGYGGGLRRKQYLLDLERAGTHPARTA
ncbi:MAG: bifunctional transcriptional activator/DNA repair protein Ada [Candidatus Eisenbacteria bacterium]|nr:bifunctional transcriptional activator/DNA repair protein Ada [Candidatus Eisenbacteria bacterium]